MTSGLAAVTLVAVLGGPPAPAPAQGGIVFRRALDDAPLDIRLRPNEPATEAVKHFHATGENPYVGRPEALADGKKIYETWCQSCHMPDGSGGIGRSLIDGRHAYPRTGTDVGSFEIVLDGGFGAMQPFRDRLTQDEILKVIAYTRSLKR